MQVSKKGLLGLAASLCVVAIGTWFLQKDDSSAKGETSVATLCDKDCEPNPTENAISSDELNKSSVQVTELLSLSESDLTKLAENTYNVKDDGTSQFIGENVDMESFTHYLNQRSQESIHIGEPIDMENFNEIVNRYDSGESRFIGEKMDVSDYLGNLNQ